MALSARMGLQPGTMRRSLVLELAILLFGGLAGGRDHGVDRRGDRDPVPRPASDDPTGADLGDAVGRLVAVAVGLAAVAVIGGWLAGRAARDVRLGEVLRVAD